MSEPSVISLLIADDEYTIRNGLSKAVDWEGENIRLLGTAENGLEASAMIESLRPDLVITDIRMPGRTGLEIIAAARETHIPTHFIILSGYDDFAYAQQAIESGVDAYLLKPVTVENLLPKLRQICGQIRKERSTDAEDRAVYAAAHMAGPALRHRFYSQLAQGEYHNAEEIRNGAGVLADDLIPCPCIAAVLRFTLPQEQDSAHFSRSEQCLFRSAIRNVTDELAGSRYRLESFYEQVNAVGLLISPPDGAEAFVRDCIRALKGISANTNITAGLSFPAQTLLELPAACQQARELSEYHIYGTDTDLFMPQRFRDSSGAVPPRDCALSALTEYVIAGDEAGIEAELARFFETILYIPMPPPAYLRGMCAYLLNDVSKQAVNLLQCDGSLIRQIPHKQLEDCPSVAELRQFLKNRLLETSAALREKRGNQIPQVIEEAQRYIRNNVLSRLRVEDVAASIYLSESYFAALFKKHTGITVREFILQCKIEKAKELLLQKHLSIFEIAETLEYSDYRSFSRAFKRFVGCSPTDYQQMLMSPGEKTGTPPSGG